jgi:hypothetical protein
MHKNETQSVVFTYHVKVQSMIQFFVSIIKDDKIFRAKIVWNLLCSVCRHCSYSSLQVGQSDKH